MTTPRRYHSITIALHWTMAIGFLLMLMSGVVMSYFDIEKSLQFKLYQWHKAGGVLLLLAAGVRILWRIISAYRGLIPPLPELPRLEKIGAKLGHWGLYALMLAMPLSGWVMVSASVFGLPTIVFGWFEWPHIPDIQGNSAIEGVAKDAHFFLAISFAALIMVHIAAVIKHVRVDKHRLMARMWWSRR